MIEQSINRTRESTLSMIGITDDGLREHLSKQMTAEMGKEGCFLALPVFEHTFGWKESEITFGGLEGDLFSKSLLATLSNAPAYTFAPSMHPYTHQFEAWNTLLADKPKSVVITSGTGSGKTECFMIPILEDLIRERNETQKPLVGVRALFLYPLNALINSQQERLDAWTKSFGADIRFCLYNGKTEQSESAVRKQQKEHPNQILSRELLRKEPSPVLMTNSTMLEYMLVRQEDNPILQISKDNGSLRWIVLDEAHTYIGSQAAELSLLLRRVVQAFGKRSEEIRFVATSATIADKGANQKLQEYLANLAGVPLNCVVVIDGSRVIPDIGKISDFVDTRLDLIRSIEPEVEASRERYNLLLSSMIASKIRHEIVNSQLPLDLNDIVNCLGDLISGSMEENQKSVLSWIDVMTGTKASTGSPPFLKLRAHFFQRMLHGLWGCVNPDCSHKTSDLKKWPFGNVYVTQRFRCECGSPVFEVVFCEDCKTPHLLAEVAENHSGKVQQRSPYAGDEFSLNYEVSDEEPAEQEKRISNSQNPVTKIILSPKRTDSNSYDGITFDLDSLKIGALKSDNGIDVNFAKEKGASCCECDHSYSDGRGFYRASYLGAPFYVANAVPTVLEYCPDPDKGDLAGKSPEELPGRGRKLITFTDSRQGTARMAVRMQQEAERSRLRGLVFEVLRNAQSKADLTPKDELTGNYEEQLAAAEVLRKIGQHTEADRITKEAKAQKAGVSILRNVEVSWQDMVNELATSKDISQSILDYNKYANPELFHGQEAGTTMARLLLTREYSRRPKNQNSTETLGIITVGYQRLDSIKEAPKFWSEICGIATQKNPSEAPLNLADWKDFLKVALDFFVRENTYIRLDQTMQRWMGGRFTSKILFPPSGDIVESNTIKRWPQVKSGTPHRLIKLLEKGTGLDRNNPINKDKINHWLTSAWNDLVKVKILEPFEGGYSLNLNTLTFSLPSHGWGCPVTNRLFDTTFRGITPYLPNKQTNKSFDCSYVKLPDFSKLAVGANGKQRLSNLRDLVARDNTISQLRKESHWTDISDRTIEGGFYYRTAEHSAQQSAEKLEKYEELFKTGKVNVLNCSTTMEMGVDIGGISAVVMNNVPPHPANYLQRAGRAGRRSESRAIAYTLCKSDPHNQRAFTNPKWPFETIIPAPSITLSSDRIVQRHVNSQMLALFLRNEAAPNDDRTKLSVKWFFSGGEESPCNKFVSWIGSHPDDLQLSIKDLVQGTGLAGRSISSIVNDAVAILTPISERWINEYKKLNEKIQITKDDAYKRALEFELKRHEGEYLLRDLTARAFLPGYGFPTNVVNLNTYNIEDFNNKSRIKESKSREDNVFSLKEQPTRGLDIAIREYAPGAQVVIDGRVYRSAGVSLHWHSGGAKKEEQKFDITWRCQNCGAAGLIENAYSNSDDICCTHCKAEIPFSKRKQVLRPAGFLTDFYESTTNDISSQKYIRVERPRIQLEGDSISLPDSRCGHIRFGHSGSVFYHSSGEHENGYAICMSCGRAESMTSENEVPKSLVPDKSHRPIGGEAGSHKEKDCSGNNVKSNVYLGYQIPTDVLEVFLKSPISGRWLSDNANDQVIAMTIAVALRDVIADMLGISSSEMGFGIRLDKDLETNLGRAVVQLYDQVSGGAGFVIAGVPEVVDLLNKAYKRLSCPANCEIVCSCCLAGQDTRVELEELDRRAALVWLKVNEFNTHLALPKEFANVSGARYCSYTPKRFIRSSISKGAKAITIVLGGNHEEWDLSYPTFRDDLITWSVIDKLEVGVVMLANISLSNEQQQSLSILTKFGISVREVADTSFADGIGVFAQLENDKEIISLLSKDAMPFVPGPGWLDSNSSSVWITTNKLPALNAKDIDVSKWDLNESGADVIDVTQELNGELSSFSVRLETLFSYKAPELKRLIEEDEVTSISYTDRYMNSPWSVMLFGEVLRLFSKGVKDISLTGVEVSNQQIGRYLNHDWHYPGDQSGIIKTWIKACTNVEPDITFVEKTYEISHGRVFEIKWKSGKSTQLMFDQGMGYWRSYMCSRSDSQFDFHQDVDGQAREMIEKYKVANVTNSGSWPTYITVVNK